MHGYYSQADNSHLIKVTTTWINEALRPVGNNQYLSKNQAQQEVVATLSSFLDFNFEKYHLIKTITQNNAAIMVVRVAIWDSENG